MSRGLAAFDSHPWTFERTRSEGLQRGIVTHVVDGDTYDILVDDGRRQYSVINVRLRGVDTPEINSGTPEERELGFLARDFITTLFSDSRNYVLLATFKDVQTFGRWVADVYIALEPPAASEPSVLSVAEILRQAGHVKF